MARSKIPLEVGLAALMLTGILLSAALAASPENDPRVGSGSRALSPGTTQPSNVTNPAPQVPGVIITPQGSDPVVPAIEPMPEIRDLPWRRVERMK